jgi:energy-coupling factor transporter ATP-binding protein EcfA2
VLSLVGVTFRYPGARRPSLTDVSLQLGQGEVVALLGPNEAGKSTTCLVAAGLAPRAVGGTLAGGVRVDDRDLAAVPSGELAGLVGIGFAAASLSGICSTVYEEVAFGPMNLGLARGEVMGRTEQAMEAVAIGTLASRDPEHLSGGQRQLVAIAGVLAMRPRHLVLDEPTAMLDPAGTRLVGEAIARLAADGVSILVAEQKTELLAAIATRAVVLAEGRVVLEGAAASVLADPVLEALGIEAPTQARLGRLAAAAGVDPGLLEVPA